MSGSNSIDKNIKSKFEEVYNYIETNDRDHDNITKLSDYSDTSESLQYINAVFQDSFSFNKNVCLFEDRLVQTYLKIYYENNTTNYQTNKNLKTILNKTQIAEMIYIAKNELLNSWKLLLSNISFQILRNYEQEKLKKILFFKHLTIAENSFKKLLNIKDCYSNVSKSNIFTDNANFVRLKSLLLLTLDKKFSKLKLKKLDILKLLNINLLVYQKKKKQKERVNTPASEIYKMYENTCYPSDEEFFDEFVKKSSVLSSSCFNVFKDSTISDSETKLESINLSRESSICKDHVVNYGNIKLPRSNSEHLIIHKHHDYFECGDFEIKIKWRNFKEYECLDINYEPNEYNINHFCKLKSNITYDEWIQQELEKDKISKVENFNLKDNVVNDRENEIDPLLRVKLKTDTLHRINEKEMKLQKLEKINDDYEFSFSNNLNSNNFLTDQDNKYEVLQFAAPYIQYEPSLKFAPIMDLFDQNFNGLIGEISHEVMENLDKNLHIEKDINNVYTQVMKILDNSYTNLTENHNNIAPIQKKDVLNVKMSNLINKSEYKTMINNEIITRDEPPWNFEYPKKEWVKRLENLKM